MTEVCKEVAVERFLSRTDYLAKSWEGADRIRLS